MKKKLAEKASEFLVAQGVVSEEEREVYEYGIYSLGIKWLPIMLFLLAAQMAGTLLDGFIMLFAFMKIRKYSGGYHASSLKRCLITSLCLLGLSLYFIGYTSYGAEYLVLSGIAVVMLSICSPIDSENKRLDEQEKRLFKKKTILYSSIFLILQIVLGIYGKESPAIAIGMGLILSAGLQVPCVKTIVKNNTVD